ncbi:MAG: methyl acetate hydrolase [Pseudonocardiales bacterium]|nr:methyl acetate hydrolase [Pseudonocardiales bacterium]
MTPDTLFEVSALLRPILAVAALQLVDAEMLGLDEPLRAVLPELAAPRVLDGFDRTGVPELRPASGEITLRRLLSHTAGFTVGSWWHGALVLEDLWSLPYRPGSVTLLADPGTRWLHCADTDLIAMVIERTSGLPMTEYLKSGIFRELGMLDTGFDVPHRSRARVAGGLRGADDVLGYPSFYSTPRDYFEFVEALLWRDESLLSPAASELLRSNQTGSLRVPKVVDLAGVRTAGDINVYPEMRLYPNVGAQWSLGFMLNAEAVPDGPRAGSLSSAGNSHTFCWIDPSSEVAGLVFLQPTEWRPAAGEQLFGEFQRSIYAERDARVRRGDSMPNGPDTWPVAPPPVWWPF